MSSHLKMVASRVRRQAAAATSSKVAAATTSIKVNTLPPLPKQATSGLTPIAVALTLAVLFGVFLTLLLIGELCKIFNKPRREATPYITGQQKLFQPSAAGYGTRVAGLTVPEKNKGYGSRASLLHSASPMGQDPSFDDSGDLSSGTPSTSGGGQGDYFGKMGHNRGQSSGIQLPGATAAAARRGGGTGAHPPLQGATVAPDGSGFRVGQTIKTGDVGAGFSGYASRSNGAGPSSLTGAHRRGAPSIVGLGPPPATSARRASRYSRRLDSIGPGAVRKSMFMNDEGLSLPQGGPRARNSSLSTRPQTRNSSMMPRVDSVGVGDHRRKSTNIDAMRRSRSASIYNHGDTPPRQGDPLGVRGATTLSPPSIGPVRSRNFSPPTQPSMPPLHRQPSPNALPSPDAMGGAPIIGKPMPSSVNGYPMAAAAFPGGGMPRLPSSKQGYAPSMAAGYPRGTRQVV